MTTKLISKVHSKEISIRYSLMAFVFWVLTLCWIAVIFHLSAETDIEVPTNPDMDALLEKHAEEEPPPHEHADEEAGCSDTIATAMAMLVIENTRLREIIKHLRDTISVLTDHNLF